MKYKIDLYLDKIIFYNNETNIGSALLVSFYSCKYICDKYEKEGVLKEPTRVNPGGETETIQIKKDGVYILEVSNPITNETEQLVYSFYNNLLNNTLIDIYKALCNCGCESCDDCVGEEELIVITNKLLATYFLIKKDFKQPLEKEILYILSPILEADIKCILDTSIIRGYQNIKKLQKHLVATLYLILYIELSKIYSLQGDKNKEELKKFNKMFHIEQIFPCLKSLCLPINCFEKYLKWT